MNYLKITASLFFLSSIAGCVILNGPKNEAAFSEQTDLKELEGCYENRGDGGKANSYRYLASYIFNPIKPDVRQAHYIRVTSMGERSIKVSAESQGKVLQEQVFVEGRDFNFESGKIRIRSDGGATAPTQSGSVFLGVAQGSTYLGIDKNGDGKLQDSGTMLGTVFLVVPIAGHVNESFRFKKTPELCKTALSP
ncbi:hypothetical protein DBR37_12845 [Herminiimonas sp. KBW02]|uniref:hypothetical protein n=1 Tax=Herminiimonas sp. KBW02 TaxID=2153363 RepID=UPI000F5A251C|nr:hypothetical protein [Herminiimonas sp. KBW02]RQO34000.1 hypothetical protein DBR37_12845 [Herminiimonas sp. KBW02]